MRPLVWTDWPAAVAAALPIVVLLAVELGTSRSASRNDGDGNGELVLEESTGRMFDRLVAIAVVGAVASSLGWPQLTIEPRLAALVVGVVALVGALVLSGRARRHLGRFHRHRLTSHPDHELVDSGPYRVVRHPIYTATILAFLGLGAVLGNWLSVALLTAIPALALVRRIRVEEAMLLDRLGDDYAEFCRTRSRLVPYVW